MRLIDADALGVGRCSRDVLPADYCAGWNGLIRLLEKAPTVDAVPVVHGRWNNMDGYKTRKVCSECGWDVPEYGKFYSYCPNCGAKMDGGNGDAAD
jgi:hypothetical protein